VLAYERASRPKAAKLVTNTALRTRLEQDLQRKYSSEQIAGRLHEEFPDQEGMWVSTGTIYQSLYVQSRGALRRDLVKCLHTGRALRQPNRQGGQRKNRVLPVTWSTLASDPLRLKTGRCQDTAPAGSTPPRWPRWSTGSGSRQQMRASGGCHDTGREQGMGCAHPSARQQMVYSLHE